MVNSARASKGAGVGPLLAVSFLLAVPSRATDWLVSPDAISSSYGFQSQPLDLATAISGQVGGAGDTFWLRGGNYRLGHVNTSVRGAPGRVTTFRPVAGEKARIDGSFTFFESSGYVVVRDLEIYCSDTNRVSQQFGMGYHPTDINPVAGVACYAPNFSFINLIVHDQVGQGFYLSQEASNNLVYGCVVFNNGWVSPDNAEGHNFYVQGDRGTKRIYDNLAFNNCGANFHIYENAEGGSLLGITLDGNVAFNAGALQSVRSYRDWVVGVDSPSISADSIVLKNNMGYIVPGSPTYTQAQIGRDGMNGEVVLTDNYMPMGLLFNNWNAATFSGNVFAPLNADYIIDLQMNGGLFTLDWDNNTYCRPLGGNDFRVNSSDYNFFDWTGQLSFDANSSYIIGSFVGTQVFVRSNRFETGRAHLIVYNWANLNSVEVDVSSVLPLGQPFEVRNAQDYFAPPVLSGTFDGQPLDLPMEGLTVARPNGPFVAPPPTGPTFNVFVLLPVVSKLRLSIASGAAQISWPTNSGLSTLEFRDGLSITSRWVAMTNFPTVIGEEYLVRDSLNAKQRFYRLNSLIGN